MHRRTFLTATSAGLGALLSGCRPPEHDGLALPPHPDLGDRLPDVRPVPYRGPNVVLVRFGGGVRRQETIADPSATWCPFILHELAKQGVLCSNLEIASAPTVVTSHVEGTLYLLTGRYDPYKPGPNPPHAQPVEPAAPTLFDYFRRQYQIAEHQTVAANGEERGGEKSLHPPNHRHTGVRHRAPVLSLPRFEIFLLRQKLERGGLREDERAGSERRLRELERDNPCPTD